MKQYLSLLFLFVGTIGFSQDFSNKGKDFWVGYGNHVSMFAGNGSSVAGGGGQDMKLYFTSDVAANVTVTIPATGWTRSYTVSPNSVTESDAIPKSGADDARLFSEGISTKGIHVVADHSIVAYAHVYNSSISGATLLFPTATLGKQYYSLNFDQHSNAAYSYCFFYAIATDTGTTTVEITPSASTQTMNAGQTYSYNLQQGQVINVLGTITNTGGSNGVDLTGSLIKSVSTGTSGCKPLAVFSGSGKINMACPSAANGGSADNYMVQCFPANAWGKNYLTLPTKDMPNNYYRVMVNDPSTIVTLNGTILTSIINNRYYQFENNTPNYIQSDKPIMVAEYITTTGACGNNFIGGNGDPEMIYLSAIEQTINNITFNSTPHAAITKHYFNVVMRDGGVASFKLDGIPYASSFVPHPSLAGYSYAQLANLSSGSHTAYSDSGFNAIAYGYGSAESYGYNAGTNVKDLYQFVTIQNQYATVNFPSTCVNTPFTFSITLPYPATSLFWDFHGLFPNVTNNNPIADSVYTLNGKTLYVYHLPGTNSFANIGTYPITVNATNATSDGCNGINQIDYDIQVFQKPIGDFTTIHSGCVGDSVHFFDATNGLGRPTIKWKWEFGDIPLTKDSVKNPVKLYNAPGTYYVHLLALTDIGCFADTIKPITISAPPKAKFGISTPNCPSVPVTFTDSSSIATGTIVAWFWDYGNGTPIDSLSTNSPRTVTYSTPGNYTIKLFVKTASGCKSNVFSKTITINPKPVVDFTLPSVCLPTAAQFNDLSTITDGTQSQFTYSWDFGDGGTSVIKNPLHIYTTGGPFNVHLTVTSGFGCIGDSIKALTQVFAHGNANFNVLAENCLRDSSFFTDQSIFPGQTINNWHWSFGDGGISSLQNPSYLYATAGTYTVKLWVNSNQGCTSDTMIKTVKINPLPTAQFITSAPACETKQITFTDQSLANAGNITNWSWNLGDATLLNLANGNPFNHVYAAASIYQASLAVSTDKGCKSDTLFKNVIIHAQPVPNFGLPEVCLSDAFAQFSDSSTIADGTAANFTYAWNFGDPNATIPNPNTSALKNPKHKYSATGVYNITLKITSSSGCTATVVKTLTVNGDIPVAKYNILNANQLCSNTKVQIQNKSTVNFGSITKVIIYWDWANNPAIKDSDDVATVDSIYSHQYPNFQTPNSKAIQIRLLAYSGGSCVDDTIRTITLNASPKITFATMPGICLDANPLQITQATVAGPAGSFTYTGTGVSSSGLFTPTIPGVGVDSVFALFVTNAGCRDSAKQVKTVWPRSNANFGFSAPVCETKAVNFTDSSMANFGNLKTWKWAFGDGQLQSNTNGNSFPHTYLVNGNYNVSLQVISDSGCTSLPVQKTVVVHPLPVVDFSLPTVCLPAGLAPFFDSSKISDNSQSQFSYAWDFGEASSGASNNSSVQNGVHNYSGTGPFTVQLSVTSKDGCTGSKTKLLTDVNPQPKADFATVPTYVCLGAPIQFNDQTNPFGQSITNWFWDFADNSSANTKNANHTYGQANSYPVKLYVKTNKGCFSDTASNTINVYPFPVVSAGPDQVVLQGGQVQLQATVSGSFNYQYLWTPTHWLSSDTVLKPNVINPLADETYTLKVTSAGGCSATSSVFVKLLLAPVIPNAFSPNGDGINDVWSIKYLDSYPGTTVDIFDRYGRTVFSSVGYGKPFDGKQNGKDLPVGVYYYVIDPKNGRSVMTGSLTILR